MITVETFTWVYAFGWIMFGGPTIFCWASIVDRQKTQGKRALVTLFCLIYCVFIIVYPWLYFCSKYLSMLVR